MKAKQFTGVIGVSKEQRVENDVYPTPTEVTHALMIFLRGYLGLNKKLNVLEPACDIGGMSKVIEQYGHKVTSTDLRFTGYGSGGIDYLQNEFTYCDAVITNPPFNLSQAFIEKALKEADIVCMVLKSQYWHAAKRAALYRKTLPAFIMPLTWRPDFSGGGSPTMDCIWTVWIKGVNECKYIPLDKPILTHQPPTLF